MECKILLSKSYGYKWFCEDRISVKGYFILNNERFCGEKAIDYLNKISDYNDFIDFLRLSYGMFSIIINKDDCIWVGVDVSRTFPIYYNKENKVISDDIEKIRVELGIDSEDVNVNKVASIMASQFLPFNDTVYDEISQLDFGQVLYLDKDEDQIKYYYKHINEQIDVSYDKAITMYGDILDTVFDRLIVAIDNRPVVLSLSGGYDSRYVAMMLKEKGVNDVTCYTYGKSTSNDALLSKEIANKLGYNWYCVEHTDKLMNSLFDDELDKYMELSNKGDNDMYLQNYLAFRKLHSEGKFKPNSVVLTGLCGDMPSGNYIMKLENYDLRNMNSHKMAIEIFESVYHRYKLSSECKDFIIKGLVNQIERFDLKIDNLENYIKVKDSIETRELHGKVFLNMNCVHDFFGYEFLLPLWDKDFLDFWYSIPVEYRVEQNMYEYYLNEVIGKKYDINIYKNRPETITWSKSKKRIKVRLKYFIGGLFARFMYTLNIPIRRKYDINNFQMLAVGFHKRIKYKKVINYKKANLSLLIDLYVMEKRYGVNVIKAIDGKVIKRRG